MIRVVALLAMLSAAPAFAQSAPPPCDMSSTHCHIDSPLKIYSFGMRAAVLLHMTTLLRTKTLADLRAHKISKGEAIQNQGRADSARKQIDSALAACHIGADGNCTAGDPGAMQKALWQAEVELR